MDFRRLIVPIGILFGVGLFVVAGFLAGGDDEPLVNQPALEAIIPVRDAEILSRDTVGADLAPGFQGRLSINGTTVPADQLEPDGGLNRVLYRPGEGKIIEQLDPDLNCAEITFWPAAEGPDAAGPPLRWCFTVL